MQASADCLDLIKVAKQIKKTKDWSLIKLSVGLFCIGFRCLDTRASVHSLSWELHAHTLHGSFCFNIYTTTTFALSSRNYFSSDRTRSKPTNKCVLKGLVLVTGRKHEQSPLRLKRSDIQPLSQHKHGRQILSRVAAWQPRSPFRFARRRPCAAGVNARWNSKRSGA